MAVSAPQVDVLDPPNPTYFGVLKKMALGSLKCSRRTTGRRRRTTGRRRCSSDVRMVRQTTPCHEIRALHASAAVAGTAAAAADASLAKLAAAAVAAV